MNRLMLDFETLDMGAVVFNEQSVIAGLSLKIDQQSCLDLGCTISEDTVEWWAKQSNEAKAAAFGGTTNIRDAMEQLIQLYIDEECIEIWSQGALADIRWANNVLTKLQLQKPWEYYQEMCSRTLLKYSPQTLGIPRTGTHHDAYNDAFFQAQNIILQLRYVMDEDVNQLVYLAENIRTNHEVPS